MSSLIYIYNYQPVQIVWCVCLSIHYILLLHTTSNTTTTTPLDHNGQLRPPSVPLLLDLDDHYRRHGVRHRTGHGHAGQGHLSADS